MHQDPLLVNLLRPSDTYAQRQSIIGSDDGLSPGRHQAITCTSVGNCQLYYQEQTSAKFKSKLIWGKRFWTCRLRNVGHFVSVSKCYQTGVLVLKSYLPVYKHVPLSRYTLGYHGALRSMLTSNGSWCMGIKGEMSGTVCVTFTWYMYIYELFIAFVCFVVCSLL